MMMYLSDMIFFKTSQLKPEKRRDIASGTLSLIAFLIAFLIVLQVLVGAQDVIAHRDLVIDLGNGLKTDAQLTLPVVGKGPFPGVLLIQGSGPIDMNEYLPPTVTGSNEPSRPFLQIAEYLSSRGFSVLRFNKRGVGLNDTILDASVVNNTTYQNYKSDAEKALKVLEAQPEVNGSDITILGHSEGAIVAPRIALENIEVKKIVLMSATAENLRDLLDFQLITRPLLYADQIIDTNHDGLLSIKEVEATMGRPGENLAPLPAAGLIEKNNTTDQYQWYSIITTNRTGNISIQDDLKPLITEQSQLLLSNRTLPGYEWLQSYFALDNTTDIIGNVSASILILQGENDTQVPVQQAMLLEQKLMEVNHPDHTLITYPGLGHTFYPSKNWIQPLGPIGENVLGDLHSWLTSPARKVRYIAH
jgi:pimeloyl-ACP methyl ester carboxylesterase